MPHMSVQAAEQQAAVAPHTSSSLPTSTSPHHLPPPPPQVVDKNIPPEVMSRYPFLFGCTTLRIPAEHVAKATKMVTGQLAASVADANGMALDATGEQAAPGPAAPCAGHSAGALLQPVLQVWNEPSIARDHVLTRCCPSP
jgi:hypothetical protein